MGAESALCALVVARPNFSRRTHRRWGACFDDCFPSFRFCCLVLKTASTHVRYRNAPVVLDGSRDYIFATSRSVSVVGIGVFILDAAPSWDRRGEIFSTYVTSSERLECRGHLAQKPSRILRFFGRGAPIFAGEDVAAAESPSANKHLHILRNLGCGSSAHKMRRGALIATSARFYGCLPATVRAAGTPRLAPDRCFFLFLFFPLFMRRRLFLPRARCECPKGTPEMRRVSQAMLKRP